MIFTGVDWSGNDGLGRATPVTPDLLCIAFASISDEGRARLRYELAALRSRYGFAPGGIFKHSESSARIRSEFMSAIANVGVEVRVQLIDKWRDWPPEFVNMTGPQRTSSAIAQAAARLPRNLIEGNVLLLDLEQKKDGRTCSRTVGAVNRATRTGQHRGFHKVKCCPDTDLTYGEIIQVADMVAGAVRKAGVEQPPQYPELRRIVVPW